MSGKKYVPEGVFLVCDKGAKPSQLKSLSYTETTMFGKNMCTKVDKQLAVNFEPFGACACQNGNPCTAPVTDWTNVTDGIFLGGNELLLEDSELPCSLGGKITIFYSKQAAMAALPEPPEEEGGFWESAWSFTKGVGSGLWSGAKGTVTGVYDMAKWAGKHSLPYALANPEGFTEQLQQDKQMLQTLGGVAKDAGVWAYRNSSVNRALDPADWAQAQQENQQMFDNLMEKAGQMDAEEWGNLAGQGLFEAATVVGTGGVGAAAKAGKLGKLGKAANQLGRAGRAAENAEDVASTAKAAETVEDIGSGPRKLGDVVHKADDLTPGSPAHKAQRWQEYQERGGDWDYDRWSKTYDNNMQRARKANQAADNYHETLGWGKREVTVDVNGQARRLDIADVADRRGVEVKSGEYFSRTEDIMSQIARDKQLVRDGWEIDWVIEGKSSQPLLDELKNAGINVIQK